MPDRCNAEVPQADEFKFDKGGVHRCMGGDYWLLTARLYNFDAKKVKFHSGPLDPVDRTRESHRREYELSKLDPSTLGIETWRVCEHDLVAHFDNEATREKAREYYREECADA